MGFWGSPFCQESPGGWCLGNPGPVGDSDRGPGGHGLVRQRGRCWRVNVGARGPTEHSRRTSQTRQGAATQNPSVARAGLTVRGVPYERGSTSVHQEIIMIIVIIMVTANIC